jgi:hypothetical protein
MTDLNSDSTTTSETRLRVLVTIGVPLGILVDSATREKQGLLRHGRELLKVDHDAYQILYRAAWTAGRQALVKWATERHATDWEAVIARCMESGLLREIDFRADRSDQWSGLRLATVGLGVGPDANDRWHINLPDRDPAEVDRFSYLLWAASDGGSLHDVADMLADEFRDSRDLGNAVIPLCVLKLLTQGAAFLDRVP